MKTPVRAIISLAAFLAANSFAWCVFYVGGGELFTADAGFACAIGILIGLGAAFESWNHTL